MMTLERPREETSHFDLDRCQLEQAVNASGEVIFMTDSDGVLTFVNPAFQRLYGYAAEEVVGRTTPRVLGSGFTPPAFYESLWQRMRQGEIVQGELVNRTKAGALVHVEMSANPVRNDRHEIVGFLAVQRDVTARRVTEAALRNSEARYRTLAEAARDAIFIIGVDRRFEYVNLAGAAPFNLRPDQIIGKRIGECFPADISATIDGQVSQVLSTATPLYVEQLMPFPQGSSWQGAWLVPMFDEDQHVTHVMGVARDITERRKLAALLERQNGLLNAIIESSPIGIAVVDGASLVCNVANPELDRLAGRPILGLAITDLWPAGGGGVKRMLDQVLASGTPADCADIALEIAGTGKTPTRLAVTVAASRLTLPAGTAPALLVMVTDTTKRKELEEQFFQAQKMEAIGRLAGGVAHDFNNLLMSILGYAELVADTLEPTDRRRGDIDQIRRAGESAATLTRQLLAFSRKQVAQDTVLDVNIVVSQFEKILRRTIGEDIEVTLRLDPAVDRITMDAGQLEQILMNLSVNARDAMTRGGSLTIATSNIEVIDEKRAPRRVVPGCYVALRVSDTGIGMSPEVQSHVFEPFFTTKAQDKGTGLGLSTVFGIVTQHGGQIEIESEVNRGTTLTIYFPSADQQEVVPNETEPELLAVGSETILLVEDNDSVRVLTKKTLESFGYQVLGAANSSEALRLSRESSRPIHLLLTDVVMPGEDGVELSRTIAGERADTMVLYMSGYTDGVISARDLVRADARLLQKPFTRDVLARKVRQTLDAGVRKGPVVAVR